MVGINSDRMAVCVCVRLQIGEFFFILGHLPVRQNFTDARHLGERPKWEVLKAHIDLALAKCSVLALVEGGPGS